MKEIKVDENEVMTFKEIKAKKWQGLIENEISKKL